MICTKCKIEKERGAFRERIGTSSGLHYWCRKCERDDSRKKYIKKPRRESLKVTKTIEHLKKIKTDAKMRMLKYRYGISEEEYNIMYIKQEGKCAICMEAKEKGGRIGLYVDHNHTTNKFRGLLCPNCNTAIGKFKENIIFLEAAIEYIKKQNHE